MHLTRSFRKQSLPFRIRPDAPKSEVKTGWLTIAEAAIYARVCKRTIHNWRKNGLPYIKKIRKTIRILPSDIDDFLLRDYSHSNPDTVSHEVDAILKDLTK